MNVNSNEKCNREDEYVDQSTDLIHDSQVKTLKDRRKNIHESKLAGREDTKQEKTVKFLDKIKSQSKAVSDTTSRENKNKVKSNENIGDKKYYKLKNKSSICKEQGDTAGVNTVRSNSAGLPLGKDIHRKDIHSLDNNGASLNTDTKQSDLMLNVAGQKTSNENSNICIIL